MTGEVARLVLRNNYEQTLCLTLATERGVTDLDFQARLMKHLEAGGALDRQVESLPDDLALAEREEKGWGLTRPELAVLLAYGKIDLFGELLACKVPDDAYFGRELMGYFPRQMRERFPEAIQGHRLRREIIATMLSNSIINRGGSTMVQRLRDATGADTAEICAAFALARDVHDLEALLDEVDALDNQVANRVQTAIHLELQTLIRRQTVWFLRQVRHPEGLEPLVAHFRGGIARVAKALAKALPGQIKAATRAKESVLRQAGVPQRLARRIAALPVMERAADIVVVADAAGQEVERVAEVFFSLGQSLSIDWLLERTAELTVADYYDRLALTRLIETVQAAQRRLTTEAFAQADGKDVLASWIGRHGRSIQRTRAALDDLADSGALTLSKLQVAGAHMHDLAGD
jgi:glutamate dehydrogenase